MRTVIYHANCPDGFTAAWLLHSNFDGDIRMVPAMHGDPLPDGIDGHDVWVVDFSYPPAVLDELAGRARQVYVWDHHKTAIEDLDGYQRANVELVLDSARSGAGITFDQLFPGEKRFPFVYHIEDRDLWRFALPNTPAVFAAVNAREMTIDNWDDLARTPIDQLAAEGEALNRYRQRLVNERAADAFEVEIAGHQVLVANCPYSIGSDVAAVLAAGRPFAAYYYDNSRGERKWGLRSTDDGLDVSEIARLFGGGGHRNAAGFITRTGVVIDRHGDLP